MVLRVTLTIGLILSVLFAPLYISIILALVGFFAFDLFIEGIVVFLMSDLIHGGNTAKIHGFMFFSFAVSIIVCVLIELLKNKLKFYSLR